MQQSRRAIDTNFEETPPFMPQAALGHLLAMTADILTVPCAKAIRSGLMNKIRQTMSNTIIRTAKSFVLKLMSTDWPRFERARTVRPNFLGRGARSNELIIPMMRHGLAEYRLAATRRLLMRWRRHH